MGLFVVKTVNHTNCAFIPIISWKRWTSSWRRLSGHLTVSLLALFFVVVVKLKKKDKMNVSSGYALKRTLLSTFRLALWRNDYKTYVIPSIAFHRRSKVIHQVYGKLNLRLISTLSLVWPQKGASFCYWLALYVFPASCTRPEQKMIKNSRAINI